MTAPHAADKLAYRVDNKDCIASLTATAGKLDKAFACETHASQWVLGAPAAPVDGAAAQGGVQVAALHELRDQQQVAVGQLARALEGKPRESRVIRGTRAKRASQLQVYLAVSSWATMLISRRPDAGRPCGQRPAVGSNYCALSLCPAWHSAFCTEKVGI